MGVDRGVPSGTSQVLVLSVRDVLPGPGVAVLFGQTKVDHEDLVAVAADAHEEVVGLDVTVDKVLVVDPFDAGDHLVGQHQDRLHGAGRANALLFGEVPRYAK